jgi:rubrerythrin
VTPNTVMPRAAAADWEWAALLRYLEKLMGPRLGRAVAGGAPAHAESRSGPAPVPPEDPPTGNWPDTLPDIRSTVGDLKIAYRSETVTRAKYAAFARRADSEEYKDVAQLFRAVAESERIHARNHAAVLNRLGVKPAAGVYTKTPGTTGENLRDAVEGESRECDAMYPAMIQRAGAEEQADAVRSMLYALNAEKQHAALYEQALERLRPRPTGSAYHVCPTCGATYANAAPPTCPTCSMAGVRFQRVR